MKRKYEYKPSRERNHRRCPASKLNPVSRMAHYRFWRDVNQAMILLGYSGSRYAWSSCRSNALKYPAWCHEHVHYLQEKERRTLRSCASWWRWHRRFYHIRATRRILLVWDRMEWKDGSLLQLKIRAEFPAMRCISVTHVWKNVWVGSTIVHVNESWHWDWFWLGLELELSLTVWPSRHWVLHITKA